MNDLQSFDRVQTLFLIMQSRDGTGPFRQMRPLTAQVHDPADAGFFHGIDDGYANAILKTLEEPPARSAIILVCNAPGALLPTIRSRCRRLPLRTLSDQDMRKAVGEAVNDNIVRLAKGRPGRAIAWHAQGADAVSAKLAHAAQQIMGGEGRAVMQSLYDQLSGEPFEKLAAVLELTEEWVRAAGVEQGAESWAEAWSALEQLRIEAEDLDMDPRHALARAVGIVERAAHVRR